MARFGELLRAANNLKLLAAIGRSGGDLGSVADLVDNMLDTPQMEACIGRFRSVPGGAAMMDARYPPLQPDLDRLIQLPEGSLGRSYAQLIRQLDYDPEFFRPRPTGTQAHWLTQRIATTHDIHHVVSGFGTVSEGESGVLAITACQIGFPAYVLLTTAGQLATFRFQTERLPRLSAAVAHGMAMARQASCLAVAHWEEGWHRPVADWREELGILEPADGEPYGLTPAVPAA
ncbi:MULTISPECIES: Coq4 family protein [unclassified Synechococcus]|nr:MULTISPECIES: Coq4 family protein [unclassified Synechococcus]MEA5424576.1 Coq4 family protein [Synechococcus sp. CCY9202]